MKIFILLLFINFINIYSDCRYCSTVHFVDIVLKNGISQRGYLELHPEEEIERIHEIIKRKTHIKLFLSNDDLRDIQKKPHSLYNNIYYEYKISQIYSIRVVNE